MSKDPSIVYILFMVDILINVVKIAC